MLKPTCVCQNPLSSAKNTSGTPPRDRETEGRSQNNGARKRRDVEARDTLGDMQTLVYTHTHITTGVCLGSEKSSVCVFQDCSSTHCLRLRCQVGRLERRKNAILFIYSRLDVNNFLRVGAHAQAHTSAQVHAVTKTVCLCFQDGEPEQVISGSLHCLL